FYIAVGLGLAALIPVFILTIIIISKYKVSDNSLPKKTKTKFEVRPEASWVWAGFISLIILVLSVIMLKSTHAIDPYKQLSTEVKPLAVRVVALPWKWLFIYPEERIATINELVVPEDRPLHFELTADAPMSSFWIPKLGGMIYTMEGMVTQLNLIANETGTYEGINTEINGKGYADMNFTTRAVTDNEYN